MLPHRQFRGQINTDDIFIRLFFSVITTGLAPLSFYALQENGRRARAHFDGLPVDFVAAAVAGIGAQQHQGLRIFNVSNHADDGLSLDVFVDWIEDSGYPIDRIANYADWLARFEVSLQALPERRRHLSSLPVLESLRQPTEKGPAAAQSSRHFDEAVRTLEIGPRTPALTREYISECLKDMVRAGLIPSSA